MIEKKASGPEDDGGLRSTARTERSLGSLLGQLSKDFSALAIAEAALCKESEP